MSSKNKIEFKIYENITNQQQLGAIAPAIIECITSAFGHEMPENEVESALVGNLVIVALNTESKKVLGFSTLHQRKVGDIKKSKFQGMEGYSPETIGASLGAATIDFNHQGQGLYKELNKIRLNPVINQQLPFIRTTTQNPKVEKGISSTLNEFISQGVLKSYTIERYKLPGFYGRRLTSYPIDATGTPFEGFDYEAGDAFSLIFKLEYHPAMLLVNNLSKILETTASVPKDIDKSIEEINTKDIVQTVVTAVTNSNDSITMSMLLSEEIEDPLPDFYHKLLKEKLANGIKIHRLGFGNQNDFEELQQNLKLDSGNFMFTHVEEVSEYQRFILVDNKTLFFSVQGRFYKTINKQLISMIDNYFIKMKK